MLKKFITAEDVCGLLNEFLALDYDCASALFSHREKCNDAVTHHPSIQVHQYPGEDSKVGLIGLINGVFGIAEDGMGAICYEIDNDTNRIVSFKVTPPPHKEF